MGPLIESNCYTACINVCLLLLSLVLDTFNVLGVGGGENKEGVVSKMRITAMQRERGDERGCGNTADAHVKHGGEGEKGIWQ